MTVSVPALNRPGLIHPNGSLSKPLIDLILALVSQVNGISPADLSDIEARLAALEVLPDQIEAIEGFDGVTVAGSLESGITIHGGQGNQILAGQVFGG